MKNLYTLLLICLCSPVVLAGIDYDVRVEGNDVVVSISSDKSYEEPANTFITGEFTIAWSEIYGENIIDGIEVLSDIPFDYDPTGQKMTQQNESTYYQKFGFANPVELELLEGQSIDVLRINLVNDNSQNAGVIASNIIIDKDPPLIGGGASFINVFAEQWSELELENTAVGIGDGPNSNINLFPNPATDRLFIQLDEVIEGQATLNVTDINGRILTTRSVQQQLLDIDLSDLPVGTYYLQVQSGTQFITGQKFVKID